MRNKSNCRLRMLVEYLAIIHVKALSLAFNTFDIVAP